ncbi:MAG: hypothetical protein ACRDHN_11870 [Thermomicrobiales bacterium]
MKDRIEFDESVQDARSIIHSRALFEIILWLYAIASGLIVARLLILLFNVEGRVWVVSFIDRLTDIMVWPLKRLPGGERGLPGGLTLSDATLLVFVVLVPLSLIAFGRSPARRQGL